MVPWSEFYADVLPFVAGCPEPAMDRAVRDAAIEFCQRSLAWGVWLDPVTLTTARSYDLDMPNNSDLVRVERVTVNGHPVELASCRLASADPASHAGDGVTVNPDRISITLGHAGVVGDVLQVFALLRPSRKATGIEDALFAAHRRTISEGAVAHLLRLPAYNAQGSAGDAMALFERGIASAAQAAWRGDLAVTPRARLSWC